MQKKKAFTKNMLKGGGGEWGAMRGLGSDHMTSVGFYNSVAVHCVIYFILNTLFFCRIPLSMIHLSKDLCIVKKAVSNLLEYLFPS